MDKAYTFDAILHEEADGGAYIIFPYDLRQTFGKGRVQVHAEFNGIPYDGSIVNMGLKDENGNIRYVLGVPKAIRKKLGVADGDSLHVKITEREAQKPQWICPQCGRAFEKQDQPHYCGKPQTIDAYIARQDAAVQPRLREVRVLLRQALPEAEERISWAMPTYWKGRNIIHFAASKNHLGLYPGGEATAVFAEALKDYSVSKGAIRLPYDQPLPAALITQIAQWCYREYGK